MERPSRRPQYQLSLNRQNLAWKPLPQIPESSQLRPSPVPLAKISFRDSGYSSQASIRNNNVPSLADSDSWSIQEGVELRNSTYVHGEDPQSFPPEIYSDIAVSLEPDPNQVVETHSLNLAVDENGKRPSMFTPALFEEVVKSSYVSDTLGNVCYMRDSDFNQSFDDGEFSMAAIPSSFDDQYHQQRIGWSHEMNPANSKLMYESPPSLDLEPQPFEVTHDTPSTFFTDQDRQSGKRRRIRETHSETPAEPLDFLSLGHRFASFKSYAVSWNVAELQEALDRTNECRDWLTRELSLWAQGDTDQSSKERICTDLVKRWKRPCRRYGTKSESISGPLQCVHGCGASWPKRKKHDWLRHLYGGRQPQKFLLCDRCPYIIPRDDKFRQHQNDAHGFTKKEAVLKQGKAKIVNVANFCEVMQIPLPAEYTTCLFCDYRSNDWNSLYEGHIYDHFMAFSQQDANGKVESRFKDHDEADDSKGGPRKPRQATSSPQSNRKPKCGVANGVNREGSRSSSCLDRSEGSNEVSVQASHSIQSLKEVRCPPSSQISIKKRRQRSMCKNHPPQNPEQKCNSRHAPRKQHRRRTQSAELHSLESNTQEEGSVALSIPVSPGKKAGNDEIKLKLEISQRQKNTYSNAKQPATQELKSKIELDSLEMRFFDLHVQNITVDEQLYMRPVENSSEKRVEVQNCTDTIDESPAVTNPDQAELLSSCTVTNYSKVFSKKSHTVNVPVQKPKHLESHRKISQFCVAKWKIARISGKMHSAPSNSDAKSRGARVKDLPTSSNQNKIEWHDKTRREQYWDSRPSIEENFGMTENIGIRDVNLVKLKPMNVNGKVDSPYAGRYLYC